jgi:hypothetical protein
LLGDSIVERLHEKHPWIPILERDESQRVGVARPVYDTAGWEQLLADTDELPLETQKWISHDLASRQPPGKLLAGQNHKAPRRYAAALPADCENAGLVTQ